MKQLTREEIFLHCTIGGRQLTEIRKLREDEIADVDTVSAEWNDYFRKFNLNFKLKSGYVSTIPCHASFKLDYGLKLENIKVLIFDGKCIEVTNAPIKIGA